MSQFQHPFPELTAQPPQVRGQPPTPSTILNRLSRQQLHDLARAYGVEVKPDGTKPEILPAMVVAEQAGIFKGPVKSQYYLEKAARERDMIARPLSQPYPEDIPRARKPASEMDATELNRLCKEGGLNTFGKSRKEKEDFIDSGQSF